MKKLTCAICGHKDSNLVPHIELDHSSVSLAQYIAEHCDGKIEGVISSTLLAETKPKPEMVIEPTTMKVSDSLKVYIPRLDKNYHFQPVSKHVKRDADANRPVMLIGHTGTGKTSMIAQMAARKGQPVIRANMNGQTSVHDFIGYNSAKDGSIEWIDGVLPTAMRKGMWLIIDEIDFADPEILSVLNSVLEIDGVLTLKEKGFEVVERHEGFRIFATANAVGQMAEFRGLYQGTNIMNEAFLDRWRCHIVDYMPADIETAILNTIPKMHSAVAKRMVEVAANARQSFLNEDLQGPFSTRRLLDWASLTIELRDEGEQSSIIAAESTIFSKVSREDAATIKGIICRVMGIPPQ